MPVLVIAEHDRSTFRPGVLQTVSAAAKIGGDIHILVAGHHCGSVVAQSAAIANVAKVLHADDAVYGDDLAENLALLVGEIIATGEYSHVIAPATFFGKNLLPRIAARADSQPVSDVTGIESPDTFIRPIYAGNAFAMVQSLDRIKFLTIRPTAFDPAPATGGAAVIIALTPARDSGLVKFVGRELTKSERPDLSSARIIVSGGRGLGSADNFRSLIDPLADALNAAVGASRAAVDAGYVPNDYQVGQTGRIVAPDLYIAIGISGAIQHLAGMKDSKVIVAINKDGDAPIFQLATYGLTGDLFQIVPELTRLLSA